jgi:hypothetical protein
MTQSSSEHIDMFDCSLYPAVITEVNADVPAFHVLLEVQQTRYISDKGETPVILGSIPRGVDVFGP